MKTKLLFTLTTVFILQNLLSQNGEDIGYSRHANSSVYGLNINAPTNSAGTGLDNGTYTNMQLAQRAWSGSHAILFNSFASQNMVAGSLSTTGNTKFANNVGAHISGAGAIMFFGNGGTMDFLISQTSTGAGTDINWGTPKMRIKRNGYVGIGTTTPDKKLEVNGDILLRNSSGIKQIYTWNPTDSNWRIGMNENPGFSRSMSTAHVQFLTYASGATQGFAVGANGGDSGFEIRGSDHAAFFRGDVGIGTTTTGTHKLAVEGTIGAREIKVEAGTWSDFVFHKNYPLPTLAAVETHIKENGHLKDIPSEAEVKANGINLGEMDAKLLQKIEELTLYTIAQERLLNTQTGQLSKQQKEIQILKKENEALKSLSERLSAIEKQLKSNH